MKPGELPLFDDHIIGFRKHLTRVFPHPASLVVPFRKNRISKSASGPYCLLDSKMKASDKDNQQDERQKNCPNTMVAQYAITGEPGKHQGFKDRFQLFRPQQASDSET